MKLSFDYYDLELIHTFTIARGSEVIDPCIIVSIEHDGIVGYGEAAPTPRYHESKETVIEFLKKVKLDQFKDPFQLEEILDYVDNIAPENTSAKAAVDVALHDWIGKRLGVPLWRMWGLKKEKACMTDFTIGIDKPEIIEQKVREAEQYPILKVKVGVPNDEEIIKTIRKATKKVIRVDANEGWTSKEQAREKILWLEEQGIELIEQPLPAHDLDGTAWLRNQVHIPLIADENAIRLHDVPALKDAFDGINIKLMKCTGLREAMKMIHTAKAMKMNVMLGCMIESSVAVTAAAHLSPLADYCDLDGNILIKNDPFSGVKVVNGKLVLNDEPGLGVKKR
jgi:L-alanine-DL-glutamate epimerase-like enolase superfamily enzyme